MCDCRVYVSNMQRPSFTTWMEGPFLIMESVEGWAFDTLAATYQNGVVVLRKESTRETADLRVTGTQGESRHSTPQHWNTQFREVFGFCPVGSPAVESLRLKSRT